jgi:dCTP deaminase
MKHRKKGNIVIEPFKESNLSTSSYDVCLGEYFYREQNPELKNVIFNIYDQSQVERVWGTYKIAPNVEDIPELTDDVINNTMKPSDQVIMLAPGETILAHTSEFIGGLNKITTMMKARSSLGRSFILVCKCAGWGDVGYFNRWTMEITNVSQHYSIPLLVGSRIAQIVFPKTGKILSKNYVNNGAYQESEDLDKLMKNWSPESMLPKNRP